MANPLNDLLPKDFFKDGKQRPLKFGRSFFEGNDDDEEFLSITYDFKPPCSDKSVTTLEMDSDNNVNINVRQDSDNTLYKGSVQEASKDCFLIIDRETGEITLERVSSVIRVKRSREPGASSNSNSIRQQSTTPQNQNSSMSESMPDLDFDMDEDHNTARGGQPLRPISNGVVAESSNLLESSSSSSSSSSSDSDSDSDAEDKSSNLNLSHQQNLQPKQQKQATPRQSDTGITSKVLINDLELSSASEDE